MRCPETWNGAQCVLERGHAELHSPLDIHWHESPREPRDVLCLDVDQLTDDELLDLFLADHPELRCCATTMEKRCNAPAAKVNDGIYNHTRCPKHSDGSSHAPTYPGWKDHHEPCRGMGSSV